MLYDSYKNKILKWASVRDFVFKHKIFFCLCLAVLVAVLSTLLYFKGNFTSTFTCDEQFIYGERLNVKSSAFLAFTDYEYREKGSEEWSNSKPTKPGDYEVRALANTVFGRNYSNVLTFSIEKKKVEIGAIESDVGYGDTPTFGGNLGYDDYLDQSLLKYSKGVVGGDFKQNFKVDISSVVIKNKQGENVTSCYDITCPVRSVQILKREITLKVENASKVYDGESLSSSNYNLEGSVIKGDEINVSFNQSITDAGTIENQPTVTIKNGLGSDVTSFYSINIIKGFLTVEKRKLLVSTPSESQVYNGEYIFNINFTLLSGSLAYGEEFVVNAFQSIKDVGKVDNDMIIDVVKNNKLVSHNYDITLIKGSLEITPKPVEIITANFEGVYNGLEQYNENFTISGLIDGEYALLKNHNGRTDVGESPNYLSIAIFNDQTETTSNYLVNYNYGVLKITQRPITVKPENIVAVYDGEVLRSSKVEIVEGSLALNSHQCYITTEGSQQTVGFSENIIVKAQVFEGNTDISHNYSISTKNGTLTVEKREINVKPTDKVKEYDGNNLVADGYETVGYGNNIVSKHRAVYQISGEITELGTIETNFLSFEIFDEKNENVSQNYIINQFAGSLTVTQRKIVIQPDSLTVVYDGLEHSVTTYQVLSGSLLDFHELDVEVRGTQLVAGVNSNVRVESFNVYNGANNVTKYYSAECRMGKIIVLKRNVLLKTGSAEFVYDGQNHTFADEDEVENQGLAQGDVLVVDARANPCVVGEYLNKIIVSVVCGDGSVRTDCYNFTTEFGSIKITERELNVKLFGGEWVYDGYRHSNEELEFVDCSLADGDNYIILEKATIFDVGSVENYFNLKIEGADFSDRTFCYKFNYDLSDCTLTVTPRYVYLNACDTEKIYDGLGFGLNETLIEYEIIEGSLANENHFVVFEVSDDLNVVGSKTTKVLSCAIYAGVVDISKNYQLTYLKGSEINLKITKRPIVIKPKDLSKYYDGNPLLCSDAVVSPNSQYSIVSGDLILISTIGSQTECGRSENEISWFDIYNGSGNSVKDNYEVELEVGYLSVSRRPITVTTPSKSFTFDGSEKYFIEGWKAENLPSQFAVELLSYTVETNASVYQNSVDVKFTLNGADVSENFKIVPNYGSLIINHLILEVETEDLLGVVYDGNIYKNSNYQILNLAEIEGSVVYPIEISLISSKEVIKAGIHNNGVALKVSRISDGFDISSNFKIVYPNGMGKIEILPRQLEITSSSSEKTFDGVALFDESFEITSGELVLGDEISVSQRTLFNQVGETDNLLEFEITNLLFDDDRTGCYEIILTSGKLKVNIAPIITVDLVDVSREYNGQPLISDQYVILEENLQSLTCSLFTSGSQTYVGSSENHIENIMIFSDGVDVTDYFEQIVLGSGTLTVTPRSVSLVVINSEYNYNGQLQSSNFYYIASGSFVAGEYMENPIFVGGSINVGDLGYTTLNYDRVYNSVLDLDVSENYDIIVTEGLVTINPRLVYIKPVDREKVYDGAKLQAEEWEYYSTSLNNQNYQFVEGQILNCIFEGEQLFVGQSLSTLTVSQIISGSDLVNLANYDLYCGSGSLTVHGIEIIVENQSHEKVYDGEVCNLTEYEILNPENLLSGHKISVVSPFMGTDAGVFVNEMEIIITNETGDEVVGIYSFTFTGEIIISKRPIYITTNSKTQVYNGQALSCLEYELGESGEGVGLANGQSLSILSSTEIINAGTAQNLIEFAVYSENTLDLNDYSANYQFEITYGTLEITKRLATIKPTDVIANYNGEAQTSTVAESLLNDENQGVVEGEIIYVLSTQSLTNVGSITNNAIAEIVSVEGGDASNYEFTFVEGSITILPLEIIIKPVDVLEIYNGQSHTTSLGETCGENSLVSGHTIEIVSTKSLTKIGVVTNNVKAILGIFDSQGNDVSANYSYKLNECLSGTIEVCPISIILTPINCVVSYVGVNVYTQKFYARMSGSLLAGYNLSYKITPSSHLVTTDTPHSLTIDSVVLTDDKGNEVSGIEETDDQGNVVINYGLHIVTLKVGSLSISPKLITVSSESKSVIYNENQHQSGNIIEISNEESCAIESGVLASGEFIRFSAEQITSISLEEYLASGEAVRKENLISNVYIYYIDELGNEVETTSNYSITYKSGYIMVI